MEERGKKRVANNNKLRGINREKRSNKLSEQKKSN